MFRQHRTWKHRCVNKTSGEEKAFSSTQPKAALRKKLNLQFIFSRGSSNLTLQLLPIFSNSILGVITFSDTWKRNYYLFCLVPDLRLSKKLFWSCRQVELESKAKHFIHRPQEVQAALYLPLNLWCTINEILILINLVKPCITLMNKYRVCLIS